MAEEGPRGAGTGPPGQVGAGGAGGAEAGEREQAGAGKTVKVKAVGFLARRLTGGGLGTASKEVPFPATGGLTVREAMNLVGIPEDEVFVVVVSGKRATLDQALAPGDEVTFVPPVAGG